jgi:predicted SnoaL-like aldol condensation-catalyzing enzyme
VLRIPAIYTPVNRDRSTTMPTSPFRRLPVTLLAAGALAAAVAMPASAAIAPVATAQVTAHCVGGPAQLAYQKTVAVRVLTDLIERGGGSVVDNFVTADLIQHDPRIADGAVALKAYAARLHQQYPDAKYEVKHVISQGDLVLVQANVILEPGTLGQDVFQIVRFQNGKIAEAWDVSETVPATTVSGNGMFATLSSPSTPSPGPDRLTSSSQHLVTEYVERVVVGKNLSAIGEYVSSDFQTHNPNFADGLAGLEAGLSGLHAQLPQLATEPMRVIAEGDLVAFHFRVTAYPGDRGTAVLDLYRVIGGKIVEQWTVSEAAPADSANGNSIF